jgi:hypothetical protein
MRTRYTPELIRAAGEGMADLVRVAAGPPPPSAYDRCRQAYIESGDLSDLDLMIEQVDI